MMRTALKILSAIQTPTDYLKEMYGMSPDDLDLVEGEFDIEEVERLADKYNLTKLR